MESPPTVMAYSGARTVALDAALNRHRPAAVRLGRQIDIQPRRAVIGDGQVQAAADLVDRVGELLEPPGHPVGPQLGSQNVMGRRTVQFDRQIGRSTRIVKVLIIMKGRRQPREQFRRDWQMFDGQLH